MFYLTMNRNIADSTLQYGLPIGCFNSGQKMALRAFYFKSSNILLHKPLSAPSFGGLEGPIELRTSPLTNQNQNEADEYNI